MAAVALLAACSSDMELAQPGDKFDGKVTLSASAYEYEDDTRTTLTSSESGISFAWDDDETIGIFPVAPTTNAQAYQKLNKGNGDGTKSSFDGAGWALLRGNTYAAYYPFQTAETMDYTKIPIDMTGQIQDGNGSLEHIGAGYDYMYATASVPKNGDVNFDFKHVVSIVKFELTMPVEATWKSFTLTNNDGNNVFTTSATMDVTTGAITSRTTSSELKLSLNNVSTTESNKTLFLYLAVLPTTIGDFTLRATTSAGISYRCSFTSRTLVAGKAYRFATSQTIKDLFSGDGNENGYAYVDLGLSVKWATMNVGASNVTDYGKYYAWGETKAYGEEDGTNARNYNYAGRGNYKKTLYLWGTYKWSNDDYGNSFSKYTTSTKTTLDPEDDAATQNWGGAWRMPTHAEQEELMNKCYWVWTSSYNGSNVAGYIIYAAKSYNDMGKNVNINGTPSSDYSLSDPHIFLSVAGYCYYGSFRHAGTQGNYWSSSLGVGSSDYAWYMLLNSHSNCGVDVNDGRCYGRSVRAVCE